jgi:hypothetical protein
LIEEDETIMFTSQRHALRVRRQARLLLESLDDRIVMSEGAGGAAEAVVPRPPAPHAQLPHHAGRRERLGDKLPAFALPLNVSPAVRALYWGYRARDDVMPVTPPHKQNGRPLEISRRRVAVLIKVAFPPALYGDLHRLEVQGLKVIRTDPAYGLAEGLVPVGALRVFAQESAHVWPAPRIISVPVHRLR